MFSDVWTDYRVARCQMSLDMSNVGDYIKHFLFTQVCNMNPMPNCGHAQTLKMEIVIMPILLSMAAPQVVATVYPKKYAHGFWFAVLCCGYTLTDFPISIRLTSLALWQSNDCPSASKATLMNMDKYFMWIHYERLHNHNKAKHNKTVCIFLGIYCIMTTCGVTSDGKADIIMILGFRWIRNIPTTWRPRLAMGKQMGSNQYFYTIMANEKKKYKTNVK